MKFKNTIIALAIIGAAGAAHAEGLYVTGAIGQSTWDEAGDYNSIIARDTADVCAAVGCNSSSTTTDDQTNGFKLGLGYRVNKNLAFEVSYNDIGKFETKDRLDMTTSLGIRYASSEENKATALNFSAVGIYPVTEAFEVFGKIGVANWKVKNKFSSTVTGAAVSSFSESDSDSGWDVSYGLGLAYNFTKNIALTGEWERVGGEIKMYDSTTSQDFTVDTLSLGLRYSF